MSADAGTVVIGPVHQCPTYPDAQCHCFHPYALVNGEPFPDCDPCPNPNWNANLAALTHADDDPSADTDY